MSNKPKPSTEVICKTCGNTFLSNRSNATFCSKECRRKSDNIRAESKEYMCYTCDKAFISSRRNATFCSAECRYSRRTRRTSINCHKCSVLFVPKSSNAIYCTSECKRSAESEARKQATAIKRGLVKCKCCPTEFAPWSARNVYCSDVCKAMGHKEVKKRFLQTEKGKASVKPQTKRFKQKHMLKTKYGLSLEQYDEMLLKQNNTCFICEKPSPNDRNLSVDHCHLSEPLRVRSLLCTNHNSVIGYCEDDVLLLCKSIAYLMLHHPDRYQHIKSFDTTIKDLVELNRHKLVKVEPTHELIKRK